MRKNLPALRRKVFPKCENVLQKRREVFTKRTEVLLKRREVFPKRTEVLLKRKEVLPKRTEVLPKRKNFLPERKNILPDGKNAAVEQQTHFETDFIAGKQADGQPSMKKAGAGKSGLHFFYLRKYKLTEVGISECITNRKLELGNVKGSGSTARNKK